MHGNDADTCGANKRAIYVTEITAGLFLSQKKVDEEGTKVE